MKVEKFTNSDRAMSGVLPGLGVLLMLLLFGTSTTYAQTLCPLACNDLVQVSLDDDCSVAITPDMMLEGQGTDPSCDYTVTVLAANGLPIPGSPVVTGTYIGQKLKVRVNLGANSCWGQVLIEDKLPPRITCPDDITITCYDAREFPLPPATDNCGIPVTVKELSDSVSDTGCNDPYSAVRTITWQATDKSGNKSAICDQVIYYSRINIDSLVFPRNKDDVEDPALLCEDSNPNVLLGGWDLNNNNYPDPTETGTPTLFGYNIFPNKSYCELNATFTDTRLDICENSFKVLRRWVVLDWCTGRLREDIQIIKVVDKNGPIVAAPDEVTISADPYTCTATYEVPPPIVIFDCSSEVTWTVDYQLAFPGGQPTGVWINDNVRYVGNKVFIDDLPIDSSWIRYTVVDDCGNITYANNEVVVKDFEPPVAVCDEFTVVTLTTGGVAQIFATTFDDGSHDNCTDILFDARRMTAGCGASLTNWTTAVNFCCQDVGKDIMVSLRVTDTNGNSNTCMVTVRVQDKIDPKITCPANITINCDEDYKNTTLTGTATAVDNCGTPAVTFTDAGTLNQCNLGTITRTWKATDQGGRFATCTQRIVVENDDPFTSTDINWNTAPNRTLNGCIDIDTDPSVTGKPTWTSDQCDLIAATYSDQVFTIVDSACFKILRTWTVIDWCQFDQNNPVYGIWQRTQVIKLNNTVKPTFASCADVTVCAYGENCNGFVEIKPVVTDDCTPENLLVWKWRIDFQDGTFKTGTTRDASGTYPVGKHKVSFSVEDKCGNIGTCTYFMTIKDCKKPTPYCLGEITTVIMPSSGNIAIWARDFDKGSFDNCTPQNQLIFTFNGEFPVPSKINEEHYFKGNGLLATAAEYNAGTAQIWIPATKTSGKLFACNNLGINNLQMWVVDQAGNQEYCTVKINIQANPGACGNISGGNIVSGNISTPNHEEVKDVIVSLIANESFVGKTDENGTFAFSGLKSGTQYNLSADNNVNWTNGVSTLDLVIIQRHILNTQKLSNPYLFIAADANNDQKISAADLVDLRKLILGVSPNLPKNKSWRFADASQTFADPEKPWPFKENLSVNFEGNQIAGLDFKAVKIGDVNNSVSLQLAGNNAEPRSGKVLKLEAGQQSFEAGSRIIVPIYAGEDADMTGMQFTMNFDASKLNLIGIVSGTLDISDDNVNVVDGKVATSWAGLSAVKATKGDEMFALVFESIADGNISGNLSLNSDIVKSEAYDSDLEVMKIELSFRNADKTNGIELMQNVPNPFEVSTVIEFVLPETQTATLKVYDITGKVVYSKSKEYVKGNNQVTLTSAELGTVGILYYQLEANGFTSTKKMIVMNR